LAARGPGYLRAMPTTTTDTARTRSLTEAEPIILRPAGDFTGGQAGWIAEVRGQSHRHAWGQTRVEALRAIRRQLGRKGVFVGSRPGARPEVRSFASILYGIGLEAGTLSGRG
jgi:hypothetical protein